MWDGNMLYDFPELSTEFAASGWPCHSIEQKVHSVLTG
jgi:hypothetical protein